MADSAKRASERCPRGQRNNYASGRKDTRPNDYSISLSFVGDAQLRGVEQQVAGGPAALAVAIVADDEDALCAIDDRAADCLSGSLALPPTGALDTAGDPDVARVAAGMTFACATDGNHGQSVAAGARLVGAAGRGRLAAGTLRPGSSDARCNNRRSTA